MKESGYCNGWTSPQVRRLLYLAGLPLVDGFYLAFLAAGLWREPLSAIAFGLTAFSGAGCVIAAMQLQGSPTRRTAQVVGVYMIVVTGAFAISLARPLFQSLLPANLHLFTGVFLIGLGLWISGVPWLQRIALWLGFETLVKGMLAASLIKGLISGITWQFSPDPGVLSAVMLAVAAGFGLTILGMALGLLLGQAADQRWLNLGAGVSLLMMGLNVLGLRVSSLLVIAPLAAGCLGTLGVLAYHAVLRRAPPAVYPP